MSSEVLLPNGDNNPHIPQLSRQSSDSIAAKWSDMSDRRYPNEYLPAMSMVCLRDEWVPHTRLARYLREVDRTFVENPSLKSQMQSRDNYLDLTIDLLKLAYKVNGSSSARNVRDILTGHNVLFTLSHLYDSLDWRRPYLAYAIRMLTTLSAPDLIVAKLAEVCDRAHRCSAAKRQAFNILLTCSFQLREMQTKPINVAVSADPVEDTRQMLIGCFEVYLDDHKERAFNSAFIEPSRYFSNCMNDAAQRDHVNIHACNYYAALVHSTLGMQLPVPPQYSDEDKWGVVSFWEGLKLDTWEIFREPEYFGRSFEGIPPLHHRQLLQRRIPPYQFPLGEPISSAKELANGAIEPGEGSRMRRRGFIPYVERFAFFFSRGFLLRKAFDALYTECKPEFVGAQRALQLLYGHYQQEKGTNIVVEDSLVEHLYTDDTFMILDEEKLGAFFAWLGIAKFSEADYSFWRGPAAAADDDDDDDDDDETVDISEA
eukprot:CAMPEP_0174989630 /NCGR_PEP_ID=MMETSP0004_2-20121128/20842_1 /TAXON_ID=420556 /ORGANISM="Ochromonas sp., Strain CCMP1393" /LENGTH=484 /DNA_ID=CAMNT_0016243087 /DNA_START=60 /DNA_END=1514 /DNA_ORIENTATION=-